MTDCFQVLITKLPDDGVVVGVIDESTGENSHLNVTDTGAAMQFIAHTIAKMESGK